MLVLAGTVNRLVAEYPPPPHHYCCDATLLSPFSITPADAMLLVVERAAAAPLNYIL